jgi:hypothetical protein
MTVPTWNGSHWILGGRPLTVAEMTAWWRSASPAMRAAARASNARTRPAAPRAAGACRTQRQAALRHRARRLLGTQAGELRARARALLAADDWRIFFKARGKLTRLDNERSRMGFELFGDPTAFRRSHR